MQRHKVFISFHHADAEWRDKFKEMFADVIDCRAVEDGDIDANLPVDEIRRIIREDYLSDSSVTVVLVGEHTWQRKHVDWEISGSIRDTKKNPRSGLVGLLLPSRADYDEREKYDDHTIPPRLYDNVKCGFAKMYWWADSPDGIRRVVDEAFERKDTVLPDNSRDLFGRNWTGERWTD